MLFLLSRMKTVVVELTKESYETFGLHIAGGNKAGIFIEAVDNWKAAQKANIQVGWRLLQVRRSPTPELMARILRSYL